MWMVLAVLAILAVAGMAMADEKVQLHPTREGVVTMGGKPVTLMGSPVKVGNAAPNFVVEGNDLKDVKFPEDFAGKVVILTSVPSLDTRVCAIETRRFNEEATKLGENVRVLTISMDLPFAQKRWCGAEGIKNVITASDHQTGAFGLKYGVLIKERRLEARAVWVIDKDGKVVYEELVKEIATEPDYAKALEAAKKAGS